MRNVIELLILAYAIFLNRFILVDWLKTLGDLSWLAFLIWCVPLFLNRFVFKDPKRPHLLYYLTIFAVLVTGDYFNIIILRFLGLIAVLVIESRIPPIPGAVWIISAVSWAAFSGYIAFKSIAFFRVLVAVIGALSVVPFFWKRYQKRKQIEQELNK